jgi:hypothetical protein
MATKKTTTAVTKVIVQKPSAKKSTKPKSLLPVVVAKPVQTKLAVVKPKQTADETVMGGWIKKLSVTKQRMELLNNRYKEILIELLKEAYVVYSEAVNTDLGEDFFVALRYRLYEQQIKIQKNTPNASLVIRYICGSEVSTKTVSEYAKVLENADYNKIQTEQFGVWLKHKTMTRVIQDQRAVDKNVDTKSEKMARARLVIMRLIEARETKPLHSWKTKEWLAEQQISENGLWIGIGNATRALDGSRQLNANMNLVMMLPLNLEMEKRVLNVYAETIVNNVEYWEKQIRKLEEKVWANELWEKLVSAGYE